MATLSFETHDELVLAYSHTLSRGRAWAKTPASLAPGDPVRLEILLQSGSMRLELAAVVAASEGEAVTQRDPRMAFVRFDDLESQDRLQAFLVEADPSNRWQSERPQASLTVVVVDDQVFHRENAARPFNERGDTVYSANDGLAGLALVIRHEPDVILSDVQMPKADGWQLLRMVRARKNLQRTPFIFLTTLAKEEDRLKGYRLGVDDYLCKPYSPDILLARVDRAVRRAKSGLGSLPPTAQDALRGDLEQVSLQALLSFLELERKSGIILLEPAGCSISLNKGRPVRARSASCDSVECHERALFQLLDLKTGRFEFVPGEVDEEDTIRATVGMLLVEHARMADEATR